MSTEEEVLLKKYKKGVEELELYATLKDAERKCNIDLPVEPLEFILIKAMTDLSAGLKYMKPEMKKDLIELHDLLNPDECTPTKKLIYATEIFHNSLSLKPDYKDIKDQYVELIHRQGQKIGINLEDLFEPYTLILEDLQKKKNAN